MIKIASSSSIWKIQNLWKYPQFPKPLSDRINVTGGGGEWNIHSCNLTHRSGRHFNEDTVWGVFESKITLFLGVITRSNLNTQTWNTLNHSVWLSLSDDVIISLSLSRINLHKTLKNLPENNHNFKFFFSIKLIQWKLSVHCWVRCKQELLTASSATFNGDNLAKCEQIKAKKTGLRRPYQFLLP